MNADRDDIDANRHDDDRTRPSGDGDGRLDASGKAGVLGSLPRTRPQRASPRRTASRPKQGSASKPAASARKTQRKAAPKPRKSKPKAPPRLPPRPPAPRQGYEPEEELATARTVHPPSAAELAESVADIFVELASAGVKSGGRLLKDVFSPLRRG